MAFEFINSTTAGDLNISSVTVNKPTNTANDDIIFAHLSCFENNDITVTVPSGWTLISKWETGSNVWYYLYYKKASSEGANYTWSFNETINFLRIVLATYRGGFDITDPIDVYSNSNYNTANGTLRAAAITVSKTNSPLIFFGSNINYGSVYTLSQPTAPNTDWDDDYLNVSDTTVKRNNIVCSMVWSGSGSTGDIDATASPANLAGAVKHAFAIALNPPSTGNPGAFFQMF